MINIISSELFKYNVHIQFIPNPFYVLIFMLKHKMKEEKETNPLTTCFFNIFT